MPATLKLDSIRLAARTEKGLRDENQDAMTDFCTPFGAVYLVADGMGGAHGGAEASLLTAEGYRKYLTSFSSELTLGEALQRATSATNSEIRLRGQSGDPDVAGMGSTVVLALFSEVGDALKVAIAHIGDSRAYLLRQGVLQKLTRDHSTVQRLLDNDQITAQEARNHPDANVITRALGPYNEVQIDVSEQMVEAGDLLLLCSDGLCGYVDDSGIAAELSHPREIGLTAEALIALALQSGSTDNITVQVLQISESPKNSPEKTRGSLLSRMISSFTGSNDSLADSVRRQGSRARVPGLLRHGTSLLLGLALGIFVASLFPGLRLRIGKGSSRQSINFTASRDANKAYAPCTSSRAGSSLSPCRADPQPKPTASIPSSSGQITREIKRPIVAKASSTSTATSQPHSETSVPSSPIAVVTTQHN